MQLFKFSLGVNMKQWFIEITDTFAGEANYSWVRRYKVNAKTKRAALLKIAKEYASGWRKQCSGEVSQYKLNGACVCLFIQEWDEFCEGSATKEIK